MDREGKHNSGNNIGQGALQENYKYWDQAALSRG
jgi:hypothetical protein